MEGLTMTTRLLIVDDNMLFRKGLAALLSTHPDFTVIGDMRGGREVVQHTLQLQPDIVVMDILQAGVNGLESVAQIKRRQPGVKVLLLTHFKTEDYVRAALRAGADGYLVKESTPDEFLMALSSVAMGKKYLSPDVSAHVVDSFLHPHQDGQPASRLEQLTTRERSILQLIAEGRTNRRAAEYLSVSPKTVEKHRASLMHKLGLVNAAEITLVALEMGLIERPMPLARMSPWARREPLEVQDSQLEDDDIGRPQPSSASALEVFPALSRAMYPPWSPGIDLTAAG
jgi:DNA-binding NarL/FixJ family response regulator